MRACGVCSAEFEPKKINQRYCCRACYVKAWPINNREKAAAKQRAHRLANPQWYESREPEYQKTYRAKLLSKRPWHYLLISRRSEAKRKNMPFELTDEWAASRWTGCCELTGIRFRIHGKKGPHPFSPSIDQIRIGEGYRPNNARFILLGVNALKGSGTDEDLYEIARAIIHPFKA